MWTADLFVPSPAPSDRLEADLADLLMVTPPAGALDRLDERVERSLRAWDPRAARRSLFRPGRRAGVIGLLAASIALGGATGSLQALYAFIAGPFDVPWHRGVALNLSQVVDGYRVTIDRAYADSTRLALAISVVDELRRDGTTQVMAMGAVVTDEDGEYSGMGASSSPDGAFAAVNVAWKVPAIVPLPAGPRQFHVVIPSILVRDDSTPPPDADDSGWNPWHEYAGPWTFDFGLDVDGGTVITPAAIAEVDGAEVTVSRVIATSNIVRVEARIGGNLTTGEWAPLGTIRHGNRTLNFVVSSLDSDGSFALLTDGGVEDASGEWTITFDELVGEVDRVAGPWVIEFSVP